MPKQSLQHKIVVITGGSSGIGAKIGFHVAQKGAQPVLLARSNDKLDKVSVQIKRKTGIQPLIYQMDVTRPEEVESVFEKILEDTNQIDILVNNAGFGIFDYFRDAKKTEIHDMLEVNVFGSMLCAHKVVGHMLVRDEGQIIQIASQAGKVPTPKSTVYAASKHAILGFINGLRMELDGTSIYVTAVNPGPIRTPFFQRADPSGEYVKNVRNFILDPDKVAEKIVYAMEKPKREVNLPLSMNLGSHLYQIAPGFVGKVVGKMFARK